MVLRLGLQVDLAAFQEQVEASVSPVWSAVYWAQLALARDRLDVLAGKYCFNLLSDSVEAFPLCSTTYVWFLFTSQYGVGPHVLRL